MPRAVKHQPPILTLRLSHADPPQCLVEAIGKYMLSDRDPTHMAKRRSDPQDLDMDLT